MHVCNVEEQVRNFVIGNFLFGQPSDLGSDESLLEKGIIDSTGVLELIAFLEEQYSIKINDSEVTPDNLDSIMSISTFVGRKLAAAA